MERRFYKHGEVSDNPVPIELCLGMLLKSHNGIFIRKLKFLIQKTLELYKQMELLKPHNCIFIRKIKFLIQETLELYKQMELKGSQGTELTPATLISGWNFYI